MRVRLFLAVFLASIFMYLPVLAADSTISAHTTISVYANKKSTTKHVFNISNANKSSLPSVVQIPIAGNNLAGITARGQDNEALVTNFDQKNNQINVTIPGAKQKLNKPWSFNVVYSSNLLANAGLVKFIQVPRFTTNLPITSHTQTIVADLELGFASIRGPQPSKTQIGVGQQLLTFISKSSSIDKSVIVLFGDKTSVELKFNTKLENKNLWWRDVALTLPPDTNQQRVVLSSIEPKPTNTRLDKDGNMLAYYSLGPKKSIDVTATAWVEVISANYKLDDTLPLADIDPLLIERYTSLTDNWQPAGLDVGDQADSTKLIQAIFEKVVQKTREDQAPKSDLLNTLERNTSLKYSDWLVGELRSRKIPARVVLGMLMSDGDRTIDHLRQQAWVETYLPGTGWITLDPWLASYTGNFGSSDVLHVALALWGIEDNRPPVPFEQVAMAYSNQDLPSFDGPLGSASATKYVILPFISLMNVNINRAIGGIVDNVVLKAKDQTVMLGSLAPTQSVTQRLLSFGIGAFKNETISVGMMNGDQFDPWVSDVKVKVNYVPLIVLILVALLAVVGLKIFRQKGPKIKRFKPSKESLMLHDEATGGEIESENLIPTKDSEPTSYNHDTQTTNNSPEITKTQPINRSESIVSTSRPPRLIQ